MTARVPNWMRQAVVWCFGCGDSFAPGELTDGVCPECVLFEEMGELAATHAEAVAS